MPDSQGEFGLWLKNFSTLLAAAPARRGLTARAANLAACIAARRGVQTGGVSPRSRIANLAVPIGE